jgi:hypothetical protein
MLWSDVTRLLVILSVALHLQAARGQQAHASRTPRWTRAQRNAELFDDLQLEPSAWSTGRREEPLHHTVPQEKSFLATQQFLEVSA